MAKKTDQQIKMDRRYWEVLGDLFGWQLYSFKERNQGSFYTKGKNTIQLSGQQRDVIMDAFKRETKRDFPLCLTCQDDKCIMSATRTSPRRLENGNLLMNSLQAIPCPACQPPVRRIQRKK